MRENEAESWRFAHDMDAILHNALYVRDVLRLHIEPEGSVPPRLAGQLPDQARMLGSTAASAVAAQWSTWWESLASQVAPAQLGPTWEQGRLRHGRPERPGTSGSVFDPPESALLDSLLRDAASRTLLAAASQWFGSAREPYLPPACMDVFGWDQVRRAARRAAVEHEVSIGEVNGCAEVLLVEGLWWHVVAPGVALCSIAAARDPAIAPTILTAVFNSYLAE